MNQAKSKENETLCGLGPHPEAKAMASQRAQHFGNTMINQLNTVKQSSSSSAHRHTVSHQPTPVANYMSTGANPSASFKGHNKSSGTIQMPSRNTITANSSFVKQSLRAQPNNYAMAKPVSKAEAASSRGLTPLQEVCLNNGDTKKANQPTQSLRPTSSYKTAKSSQVGNRAG